MADKTVVTLDSFRKKPITSDQFDRAAQSVDEAKDLGNQADLNVIFQRAYDETDLSLQELRNLGFDVGVTPMDTIILVENEADKKARKDVQEKLTKDEGYDDPWDYMPSDYNG